MNLQTAKFIAALPMGFIRAGEQTAALIALNPRQPVLVRCGGGRFICDVRDLDARMLDVDAQGDYVRDVSIPTNELDRARLIVRKEQYRDEQAERLRLSGERSTRYLGEFREECCSGVYDGVSAVYSDADPGL